MPRGVGVLTRWVIAHIADLSYVCARRKRQWKKPRAASCYGALVCSSPGSADAWKNSNSCTLNTARGNFCKIYYSLISYCKVGLLKVSKPRDQTDHPIKKELKGRDGDLLGSSWACNYENLRLHLQKCFPLKTILVITKYCWIASPQCKKITCKSTFYFQDAINMNTEKQYYQKGISKFSLLIQMAALQPNAQTAPPT